MQTAPELVSVIIPTYNRVDIVPHAIESALAQDYPNKQIIVVDDGSTDSTAQVLKRFTDIEYVHQKNSGPAAARNTGLSRARGDYVATLDSDDCWDKNYLSYGIDCLQRFKANLFFANWREAEVDGSITSPDYFATARLMQPYLTNDTDILLSAEKSRSLFIKGLPAPSSGLMMRRELVGGWETLHFSEDWLMALKAVLTHKPVCVFTKQTLWTKRRDGKNIFDMAEPTPELRRRLAVDTEKVGNRVMDLLSTTEQQQFRSLIADCYFDYAYSISNTQTKQALSSYSRSNKYAFRPRTCAAMIKTMIKAFVPSSSRS